MQESFTQSVNSAEHKIFELEEVRLEESQKLTKRAKKSNFCTRFFWVKLFGRERLIREASYNSFLGLNEKIFYLEQYILSEELQNRKVKYLDFLISIEPKVRVVLRNKKGQNPSSDVFEDFRQ